MSSQLTIEEDTNGNRDSQTRCSPEKESSFAYPSNFPKHDKEPQAGRQMKVALANIKTTQLRRDHGDIADLKASIADVGIINPVTVDNEYNLLAGWRRFQAVSELGWTEVECHVLPVNGDQLKAFRIAMDENLKRKNLTDLEVATAIKEYDELKRKLEGEAPEQGGRPKTDNSVISYGWSQRRTAKDLGISQPAVVKAIKIATAIEKYPELCAEKHGRLVLRKAENLDRRAELEQNPRIVGKRTDILPLEALWPSVKSLLLNQADRAVRLGLRDLRRWCIWHENQRVDKWVQEVSVCPEAVVALAKMEKAVEAAESLIKTAADQLKRVAQSMPTDPIPWDQDDHTMRGSPENNNQVNWHKVAKGECGSPTQTVNCGLRNRGTGSQSLLQKAVSTVAIINSSYIGTKAGKKIYNLGADKIAQYHRLRGDEVYAGPLDTDDLGNRAADKFYFSVIFTWDLPKMIRQVNLVRSWGKEVEIGGPAATFMAKYIARETGIEPHRGLDERFEHIPLKNYRPSMTFTSRGCPHHCAFCGVKKVEPVALEYDDFPLAPMIGDNNILATSWEHQELVVNRFINYDREIDINSGFDVRFFQEEHKQLYSRLKLAYWRFAFDSMEVESDVRRVAAMMRANGLDRHQVTVYALIGFPGQTVEECLYRLDTLIGLGMAPYPMRFWPLNSLDRKYVAPGWTEDLLHRMSMYYQVPNIWMSDSFENFRPGKKA